MKRVRKMLVVLLTLVIVLSMCGCGGSDNGKKLVGTWILQYDLADLLADEMGEEFAGFSSPLEMSICFEFKEDGSFTMYGEEGSFESNFTKWVDEFVAFSVDLMYDAFEEQGLGKEEADASFETTYGIGIADYLRQTFEGEVDVNSLLQEMATSCKYETSGDKLYMAQEGEDIDKNAYDVFTISGDTLKLELPKGADQSQAEILPGLEYPLEFKRGN